jgi:hypothetical protein
VRVIVIGAGGVGGWLARGLAPMLEVADPGSLLLLVDGDAFEEKNRERQDFGEFGYKAEVRAQELQQRYPGTLVIGQPFWVVAETEGWPEETGGVVGVNQLIEEGDVVFVTVDNNAARKLIFEHAMGIVYHYQRRDGVDVTDPPFDWHPEYLNPEDRNPAELSCEERAQIEGGTQLLYTNMAVASYLGIRFHKTVLSGAEDTEAEVFFDLGLGRANPYDRRPVVDITENTETDIRQEAVAHD